MNNYYLGYDNGKLNKIEIKNIKPEIASVVTFTLSFTSIQSLKDYLYSLKLIPKKEVQLRYVLEKGTKKESYLKNITKNNKIYTKDDIEFFNSNKIFRYLEANKYDIDLITYMYGELLKEKGIFGKIISLINNKSKDYNSFKKFLESMKNIPYEEDIKKVINNIIDTCSEEKINIPRYQNLISTLIKLISQNDSSIVNTYIFLGKECYTNIPSITNIAKAFEIVNRANSMGIANFEYSQEFYENPLPYILNSVKYEIYDYKKDEHGKIIWTIENNKNKIKSKALFDIGARLEGYENYIISYHSKYAKVKQEEQNEEYDDEHEEEFLEEEDFERVNSKSEEVGYKIKK